MTKATQLASGQLTNHDEITVILIEPTDGTQALVRVQWPPHPTTATAASYPSIASVIVRLIAESGTALARWKAHGATSAGKHKRALDRSFVSRALD